MCKENCKIMDINNKVTITDVARLAGVSKGTVDRVLHKRGEVSKKSAEKVEKAIKELGYAPNLYASLLATKKEHLLICILPKYKNGDYWEMVYNGCYKGGENVSHLGIKVEVLFYDQYDINEFKEVCSKSIEKNPSGVILPPFFKNETLSFVQELTAAGIPYVYIDSKLEEESYTAYFGLPMLKSGYLCANLLTMRKKKEEVDDVAIVRITRDRARQSDPTIDRRAGFTDYMKENFPDARLHNIFIDPNDPKAAEAVLDSFFYEHPSVKYIVMFSSRIHLISKYLEEHPLEERIVIGFDNLNKNIEALKKGTVTMLISQHTENQSMKAVVLLAEIIILHKTVSVRDNFMHMDILTKFNAESY